MRPFISALAIATSLCGQAVAAPGLIKGQYALSDKMPKVSGDLVASSSAKGEELDFKFFALGSTAPITRYDTELTKQLHVIGISDDFEVFIHDHVARAGKDGHLSLAMQFPRSGLYHVYADGTPSGFGQQVLRFELPVGQQSKGRVVIPVPTGLSGIDDHYTVTFDSLELVAGTETALSMHIIKDGKPATDLKPYLDVAAHAVFIDLADLTYVHSHAAASTGASAGSGSAVPMDASELHHDMAGMGAMTMPEGASVPADLELHVQPPRAGLYKLWIQFLGGGQVRTVPFVLAVR